MTRRLRHAVAVSNTNAPAQTRRPERNYFRRTEMGATIVKTQAIRMQEIIDASRVRTTKRRILIRKACADCEKAHAKQFRKDGETPYDQHPKFVALQVAKAGGSATQIAAALLHDTIEDCHGRGYNYDYIRTNYGTEVAQLVALMTKPKWDGKRWVFADGSAFDKTVDRYDDSMYQARNRAYYERLLTYHGIKAFVIKLPDILHSLCTSENLTMERRDRNIRMMGEMLDVIARFDHKIYCNFVAKMKEFGYEFAAPEKVKTIDGVVMLPPRTRLDLEMVRRLPIRLPDSTVICIYVDRMQFDNERRFEVGLPRIGNGETRRILANALPRGARITIGRSLLATGLDASELIYVVDAPKTATLDEFVRGLGEVNRALNEMLTHSARPAATN